MFGDANANKYVSGIAVHWYEDFIAPVISLTSTHEKFPDKFILATEACDGSMPWDLDKVSLGDWDRAEHYIHDIIEVSLIFIIAHPSMSKMTILSLLLISALSTCGFKAEKSPFKQLRIGFVVLIT